MKILVCVDGSQESIKAVKEASRIAEGCKVNEVVLIYVYEMKYSESPIGQYFQPTPEQLRRFNEAIETSKEKAKENLMEAARIFEAKNMPVRTIFKEGHPATTIVHVAEEEGFDMVVLGRRGLSGLRKVFLGSVSNAVLQEVNTTVLIVK